MPANKRFPTARLNRLTSTTLEVAFAGEWRLHLKLPRAEEICRELAAVPDVKCLTFNTRNILGWDSGLLVFVSDILKCCANRGIEADRSGLSGGILRLLNLAAATPVRRQATGGASQSFLERAGNFALARTTEPPELVRFTGEIALSFGRMLLNKARYRKSDLLLLIQEAGPQALPIVSLISFLVGLILAYMGAIQLQRFGAQIYIADLVSIGMTREIGALMTAIILAGRTGAAYAAHLGTMQVNEEIDALKTLSISPVDFLVLPRMLALVLVAPLLTLFAGIVGMLAGMFAAASVFEIGASEYYHQTLRALDLQHIGVGVVKGTVYAAFVGLAGCFHGMRCGRSAAAVGHAATAAVVMSIVFVVISASVLTVMFQRLGI